MFIVGRVTAPIDADLSPFQSGLASARGMGSAFAGQISNSLKSVSSSMMTVGKSLTKFITVPLAAGVLAAAKFGKDFEKEMSKVVGLVGVSQKQVNSWKSDILSMSPEVAKPPKELAEAMFFVTSAGLRGADALDVLKKSAKASAAGLGETKTIADLVTSAVNAYGIENLSAGQATDILVAAVREGKAEAAELAATMGAVLPLASELGVTFDQVAATQAAMTKTGTNAAEAATQLKSIMAGLIKPSKQAEEQLRAMGTSSSEMRKKIKEEGLLQALMDLREMTNKYGEEAMARVFPNIRALMGVLDLMGNNLEGNKKTFDAVKNSTGSLDKAFKAASETVDFKWNAALSALQANLIKFFDVIKSVAVPVLETLIKAFEFVGNAFASLNPFQQKLVAGFAAMAALIGPIIVGIATAIGVLGGIIGGVSTVIAAFTAIISTVTVPILAVIGVVGGLVTAFVGLMLSSEKVRGAIFEKFNGIISKLREAAKFIQENADSIKGALMGLIKGIATGNFGDFINNMKNLVPSETMAKIHQAVISFVEFRDKMIEIRDKIISFKDGFMNAFNSIKNVVTTVIDGIVGAVGGFVSVIAAGFANVKEAVSDSFKEFNVNAIKKAFENIKAVIGPVVTIFKGLGMVIGGAIAAIIGIIVGLFNGIVKAIDNVIAAIMNVISFIGGALGVLVGLFTGNWKLVDESFQNMWNSILDFFGNIVVAIIDLVSGFVEGIVGFFTGLYETLVGGSIVPDMINGIIEWFLTLPARVLEIIIGFVTKIIEFFINLQTKANSIIVALINAIIAAWNNMKSNISKIVSALIQLAISRFNTFKSNVSTIFNAVRNVFSSIWNSIKSKVSSIVSSLISSVKSKISSLRSGISSLLNSIKNTFSSAWNSIKSKAISTISSMVSNIKSKIKGIASSAYSSGMAIVNGIKNGINAAAGAAVGALKSLVKRLRDLLPFSPAKEGPLRDLDKLNFAGPIKKSLAKANLAVGDFFLKDLMLNNKSIAPQTSNTNNNQGISFNGDFNFHGIKDINGFMREMKDVLRRYGGKF
jgi:TP901 family phage tail tape measure protein